MTCSGWVIDFGSSVNLVDGWLFSAKTSPGRRSHQACRLPTEGLFENHPCETAMSRNTTPLNVLGYYFAIEMILFYSFFFPATNPSAIIYSLWVETRRKWGRLPIIQIGIKYVHGHKMFDSMSTNSRLPMSTYECLKKWFGIWEDIPQTRLVDCAQLVKANSIEGTKAIFIHVMF